MKGKKLSDETRERMSKAGLGRKFTQETREKISKAKKEYFQEHPEARKEISDRCKGKILSYETREKISKAKKEYYKTHLHPKGMKGKKVSQETREKLSKAGMGRKHSRESREKICKAKKKYYKTHPGPFKGKKRPQETRVKMSKARRKYWKANSVSQETKEKMSKKTKKQWRTPNYIKRQMKGRNAKPNKPETKLITFLNEHYPSEWGYNGDFSLGITLGGRIPDFVNVNGKKEVIEIFGEYWHSPLANPKTKEHCTYNATMKDYKKLGFKCLILWSKELDDMENIKIKIDAFNNS